MGRIFMFVKPKSPASVPGISILRSPQKIFNDLDAILSVSLPELADNYAHTQNEKKPGTEFCVEVGLSASIRDPFSIITATPDRPHKHTHTPRTQLNQLKPVK